MRIDEKKLQEIIDLGWTKSGFAKEAQMSRVTLDLILKFGVINRTKHWTGIQKALKLKPEYLSNPNDLILSRDDDAVPRTGNAVRDYITRVGNEAIPVDLVDETEITKNQSDNEYRDLDNGMVLMSMPLVPEYAYASYARGWKDPEYVVELPRYNIVLPKNEKGRFRAFEVWGDSMDDRSRDAICHGDIAIGRFVEPDLWRHKLFINGGTDYVIVTHDGLIIKRVIKHDIQEGIITCASVNPDKNEYPDFQVSLSEVYELYYIRKIDRDWNRR
ncbi:S24 family peptidase [Spirosoma agri]|uniref:S24 family peptidase n=1 Tax=Spirosoma agri TaxID=1987381 RepID=A0A6M0IM16_9BACT|nr:S24 family peptidase [Spirosoma agri]NEU67923.1 S24 family peptidase [Spirosoma agri]